MSPRFERFDAARARLAQWYGSIVKVLKVTVGDVAWSPPPWVAALRGKSFVGKAPPGGSLAWRADAPGSFMVRAVDDQGQADSRLVELAVVP